MDNIWDFTADQGEQSVVKRYIPKPIEACLITADNLSEVAAWCGGEIFFKDDEKSETGSAGGDSEQKTYTADVGDYIIKTKGSFFVVNGESFNALYEQIWWDVSE